LNPAISNSPPRLAQFRKALSVNVTLGLGFAAAFALVLFLFNPAEHRFYPICQFHAVTGLHCPGCGSLRAIHQLLHGHIMAALYFNALLVVTLPVIGWLGLRFLLAKLSHQPIPKLIRPAWLWIGLAAMILFGLLRNLPFAALSWLGP
jgi:hypothetical protein